MDPRGTVGRIYKEDHYTLLHTKYGSSGPCGYKEEVFLCLFRCTCKSMAANDPWRGAISDPRDMLCRMYVKLHITTLHNKYRSFGYCGFRHEEFFHVLSFICLNLFGLMLYVPVNSQGHVGTLPPLYGAFTQNLDVMTSNKCLKYNNHPTKPKRLIGADGLT